MRVVALLRGINIGPNKRIAMPALRAIVEGLGHTDVETYLQSGNVVFDPQAKGAQRSRRVSSRPRSQTPPDTTSRS